MVRFILVAAMVILFLILSIPLLLIEWLVGKKDIKLRDKQSLSIIKSVFKTLLSVAGIHVTVEGIENIPVDQAVLFVGNHRSYFDILVGYVTVPYCMGFVAKKEMEKIPLLSHWMKNVNCLFLDRKNMKEGLKTILKGISHVKNGISVWIFPEGTRNQNQEASQLLPFKEGSLKIAEKSGCPVVPVAITGTAECFEQHWPKITPSHVVIQFGEPFRIKELDDEYKKFPGAYTEGVIKTMILQQEAQKN